MPPLRFAYFFLILVLLSPVTRALEPFATDIVPTLTFSEKFNGSMSTASGDWDVKLTDVVKISGTMSLQGVDISAFNASTPYTVAMGDLTLSGTLGKDPNYVQGNTSITVPITGTDYETNAQVQIGAIVLSWTPTLLTVAVNFTAEEDTFSPLASWYNGDDEADPIEDNSMTATVTLGNRTLLDLNLDEFVVYAKGTSSVSTATYDDCDYDIPHVSLTGTIDSKPPLKPVLSFPKSRNKVYYQTIDIVGTAEDALSEIAGVEVKLNDGDWEDALGFENWTFQNARLQVGANTVSVRATDGAGWVSPETKVTFTYSPEAPLIVSVSGQGSVSNGFLGTTTHTTGQQLTVRATPAFAYKFTGWTGSLTTGSNPLTFNMAPGMTTPMTLQANFVPGPFVKVAGMFTGGFIEPTAGWESGGLITLSVNQLGALSGKISIAGKSYSLKGTFSESGEFKVNLGASRTNLLGFPLTLNVDTGNFGGTITGSLLYNGKTIPLTLDQGLWNAKTNPSAYTGLYTLVLPPETPAVAGAPEGDGYGSLKVDAKGYARGVLNLPDGGKLTVGTYVSGSGNMPVAGVIAGKTSGFSGLMKFRDIAGVSDLDGTLTWVKKGGNPKDPYYPNDFEAQLPVVGSKCDASTIATTLFSGTTSADVELGGGLLGASVLNHTIKLLPQGKTTVTAPVPDPNTLKISFKLTKGLFGGSFVDANGATWKFNGALLQKQRKAAGFFLGSSLSGYVRVDAAP